MKISQRVGSCLPEVKAGIELPDPLCLSPGCTVCWTKVHCALCNYCTKLAVCFVTIPILNYTVKPALSQYCMAGMLSLYCKPISLHCLTIGALLYFVQNGNILQGWDGIWEVIIRLLCLYYWHLLHPSLEVATH